MAAGVVGEVLRPDVLIPRPWALARQWVALSQLTLLGTRSIPTTEWKRKLANHLHTGLTYEALANLHHADH